MRALKVIGIFLGALLVILLIALLFTPARAEVSAEIEIDLEAARIFPVVASFENRDAWDPWVAQDTSTRVSINSKPGFVGSTYSWEGEKLGKGKMQVISVKEGSYIESSLWFGELKTPSLVEWSFTPTGAGTHVLWSFSQDSKYPVGRLAMIFGKIFLKQSFESGLVNLKEYLESFPWPQSSLGPISIETQPAILAMEAEGAGNMESIGEQLGSLFGAVYGEIEKQQLQVSGPAFVRYYEYDESTGHSRYRAGFQVSKKGKSAGNVISTSYPEMKVVQALHTGPYEEFGTSYEQMDVFIETRGLEVSGEAFEFYVTGMMTESDPARWQTRISFPLN